MERTPRQQSTRVAIAVFVLQTVGSGVAVYGIPIYIAVFLRSGTVSAGALSIAGTSFFLVGALSGLAFGRFGRRDPAAVMLGAVLVGTAAIAALGARPGTVMVICAFAVLGAVFNGGLIVVGTTVLVRVFEGRPSGGMALATSGSSAGGIAISPLLAVLLTAHASAGRSFLLVAGGFLVVGCAALAVGGRSVSASPPAGGGGPPGRLLAHWPLVVAFSLVSASQLGATSYVVSLGMSRGFTGASLAVSVATGTAVASRWIGSAGIRYLGLHRWTLTSFCLQGIGVVLVGVAPAGWVLFLGVALIGQSLGNTILIRSQVIVEIFGIDDFSRRFSQFQTWTSLGSALGPLVLGQVLAATHLYLVAYLALFAVNMIAAPFLLPWIRASNRPAPRRTDDVHQCADPHVRGPAAPR
jgi:MFS family permease